jgi:penicillin-binding protein 1A
MSDTRRTSTRPRRRGGAGDDRTGAGATGRGVNGNGNGGNGNGGNGNGNGAGTVVRFPGAGEPPRRQVRIRKLRVLALLAGLGALALVSTVFGMMMAVASELPRLEEPSHTNSVLLDDRGREIGVLTGNQRRILVSEAQIAPTMKHAIIAIEDRRFYTNDGVDIRGVARAFVQDVIHRGAVQGGSTITQQFVKNAMAAQDERTVFQKLKESALAYHLTRQWSKERILRDYLNTIYFGNGAYGIESAARTYFSHAHPGCGAKGAPSCASQLQPEEAALLAGMVASPSGYDPMAHAPAALRRRNLVLLRMFQQRFLTREQYDSASREALPTRQDLTPPVEDTKYPYFTSWVKQQIVDRLGGGQQGAHLAFEGGLRVKTTIDSRLQDAAAAAVRTWLPNTTGPRASLVAIHNSDGEVRAMVGGDDYSRAPFNLATQGQRQPGSAFKPFVLAEALRQGIPPSSVWASKKLVFRLKGGERFSVANYDDAYSGETTLERATTFSDNSVFAQVAKRVGPAKVAHLARRMGIRTPVSHNLAIALGGLRQGVTPLDMAHAYQTFATGGRLTYGSLSPGDRAHPGPVGIETIGRGPADDLRPMELPGGGKARNDVRRRRVISQGTAQTVTSILQTVVQQGTAVRAQIPGVLIAGKTGTTENYGDAWFVGWTKEYTVAVWVGYPDGFRPMRTEYLGEPVAGGTYPAGIWKTFMESLLRVDPLPTPDPDSVPRTSATTPPAGGATTPTTPTPSTGTAPSTGATTAPPATTTPTAPTTTAPTAPTPAPTPVPTPVPAAPTPVAPATGETGGSSPAPAPTATGPTG